MHFNAYSDLSLFELDGPEFGLIQRMGAEEPSDPDSIRHIYFFSAISLADKEGLIKLLKDTIMVDGHKRNVPKKGLSQNNHGSTGSSRLFGHSYGDSFNVYYHASDLNQYKPYHEVIHLHS